MKSEDDDLEPSAKKIKVDTEFLKGQQTYYSDREDRRDIYYIEYCSRNSVSKYTFTKW